MAYLPLSTANLPDPVIDPAQGAIPEDYFTSVLYSGNGGTQDIVTGFQPDLVWTKVRSTAYSHNLTDAVRGVRNILWADTTFGENQNGLGDLTAFNTDGFELTNSGSYAQNASGQTYVAWNWKANGSGVSNNVGSIPSTVSANTTSGFSIVSYTCPATTITGDTIGHGLGAVPEFAIFRNRDFATDWGVYHKDLGNTGGILLNSTGASFTSNEWWGSTSPTSSVMSLGRFSYVQRNSDNYIAYLFTSVEGFSKFGSYVGDASSNSDSNFVYLGFRPSFVMIKGTGSNSPWLMFDSERKTYNVIGDEALAANSSEAEGLTTWNPNTSNSVIDFLSNGFKIRTQSTTGINGSETHIYMAFAENPFKYSNAR